MPLTVIQMLPVKPVQREHLQIKDKSNVFHAPEGTIRKTLDRRHVNVAKKENIKTNLDKQNAKSVHPGSFQGLTAVIGVFPVNLEDIASYYKESRSFDICQLCKRGWFQVKRGQTTCKECPQGFYCPWQDTPPIKCDPNQKCPEGSFSAGPECNLMYNRDKSDKCKLSPVVYGVIVATAAVGLITAGILILRRHRRQTEQNQRLLERQYPVYTGW
ncbi:hypothetical protein P5673_002727 [Acropora cervicornis]|uniref:Tyrosine-protein kinase ephrin type A/B receptor-like domain-containing protein n=1 Tax=Acropora cervicornis TaxID=6130 RepID=A0AAD9VFX0_ACRCE|nr:hypothetical protein P5673_002727 [Acropora cervicornis]